MSSSSSRLSPEGRRHKDRRPSTHRICDYGRDHVSKLAFDLAAEDATQTHNNLSRRLQEREDELTKYHNELAASQARVQTLERDFEEAKEEIRKGVLDYEEAYADYETEVQRATENFQACEKLKTLVKELKAQLAELAEERDKLKTPTLKRERSPAPDPEENKRLKTESQDLRNRLTLLETAAQERDRLKRELDTLRQQRVTLAFTPEPEDTRALRLQITNLGNERDNTEKLRLEAAQRAERYERDFRDRGEELEEWEDAALQSLGPKPDETPWTPAEVRQAIERIREAVKEHNDLSPFLPVLPKGFLIENASVREVAAQVQASVFQTFNEISALLPAGSQPALITPTVTTAELGERLVEQIKEAIQAAAQTRRLSLQIAEVDKSLAEETSLAGRLEREVELWRTTVGRLATGGPADSGPTPAQAQQAVHRLQRSLEKQDNLVGANQAIIFEWENAALRNLPGLDERNFSPQDLDHLGENLVKVVREQFPRLPVPENLPEHPAQALATLLREAKGALKKGKQNLEERLNHASELLEAHDPLLTFLSNLLARIARDGRV